MWLLHNARKPYISISGLCLLGNPWPPRKRCNGDSADSSNGGTGRLGPAESQLLSTTSDCDEARSKGIACTSGEDEGRGTRGLLDSAH